MPLLFLAETVVGAGAPRPPAGFSPGARGRGGGAPPLQRFRASLPSLIIPPSFLASPAPAAPPTLIYLYPAGAQRGTTVDVTAGGTFERWPVHCWTDGKGLEGKRAAQK